MTLPPNCEPIERMLSDLLAGDLSDSEQTALAEHLEACEPCRVRAVALFKQDRLLAEIGM